MAFDPTSTLYVGDCRAILRSLPEKSVHACVTSPPYFALRDYKIPPSQWDDGWLGCLGNEPSPDLYVVHMMEIFREVKRVLRDDGTLWLNLGDSYASGQGNSFDPGGTKSFEKTRRQVGHPLKRSNKSDLTKVGLKPKDLIGIPWMVAFALRSDGWYLRSDVIWHKPNSMPESVTDRPTKAHEYMFLLSKSPRYFYDHFAVRRAMTDTSRVRLDQDIESQTGSTRANGGSRPDRRMKAVGRVDKQRGHSRRHAGFNDRWDAMTTKEQCASASLRDVWSIATFGFPGAHFATFPPALIENPIKASTSEQGCCSSCGSPCVRHAAAESFGKAHSDTKYPESTAAGSMSRSRQAKRAAGLENAPPVVTKEWITSCDCAAGTVPCTVLDPFNGAGTTGLVAIRLGRSHIGCEISPEYVDIASRRLISDNPLFANVTIKRQSLSTKESKETDHASTI